MQDEANVLQEETEDFDGPERPPSPNTEWCHSILLGLAKESKRGCKLPTPRWKRPGGGTLLGSEGHGARPMSAIIEHRPWTVPWADSNSAELSDDAPRRPASAHPLAPEKSHGGNSAGGTRRASTLKQGMSLRRLEEKTASFLPDAQQVLDRLRADGSDFSETEKDKMNTAFMRFKDPDGPEIYKDEMPRVLRFLGYDVNEAACAELADTIVSGTTMEKPDFLTFMERYNEAERLKYKELFDKFDVDGSGQLDTDEIKDFLRHLGFTPLRKMIKEAMSLVDMDGNGTLDFEEVVLLLHVYKHSEGFDIDEVKQFAAVFMKMGPEDDEDVRIDADQVAEILVKFFGPLIANIASELQAEAQAAQQSKSPPPPGQGTPKEDTKEAAGINFKEALCWARKVREAMFAQYHKAFMTYDNDGSGFVDIAELQQLVRTQGYTMPLATLRSFLQQALEIGDGQLGQDRLDYDSFIHFMQLLNQTDGFSDEELEKIDEAFDRFDEDGSGDIDVVELSDILQHLGFNPKLEDVRRLHAKVDSNDNGTLDRREFVYFMRLHKEDELSQFANLFDEFCEVDPVASEGQDFEVKHVPQDSIVDALEELLEMQGFDDDEECKVTIDAKDFAPPQNVGFDEFMEVCGKVMHERTRQLRRRAGFSLDEVAHYRNMFNNCDSKMSGILTAEELQKLLKSLGFEMKTVEDQQDIKQQLAAARSTAAADGIEGTDDSGINFWVFLRLARLTRRKLAQEEEERLKRVQKETSFSKQEMSEFQEVFDSVWVENNSKFEEEENLSESGKRVLTSDALLRMLRGMGMKVSGEHRNLLRSKVAEVAQAAEDRVDFLGFLQVMRWMMDINFLNISALTK
eukprot:TRINITY_DN62465_c0_g1_i1.p1 TRINITY_DN62465_c0_g1~~TRINITY_DN62465_c0_g1_i1.p1  ORF type:complete len:870 (+),score=257.27 TRINITY_DN62465_c0_g1_i1:47-2611(+)